MPILTDNAIARITRVVQYVEDHFFGNMAASGQRALPRQMQPNVMVKLTTETGLGFYEAEEVRREDDGAGVLTWETFVGGRVFDGANEIFEIDAITDIPDDKVVQVWQASTSEPSASTFERVVTWMFSDRYAYGIDVGGAWVEITGEPAAGEYSWKQLDSDGITDTMPAVTGTQNLFDVNGVEGIPTGTKIWARFDGTDYEMEYTRLSFLAKLTSESSGSYSWTELEGDGSTVTLRTGTDNAEELSGRLGIPTPSIVLMVPSQMDKDVYRFEYHGAPSGTEKDCNATGASANSATFDRAAQGANRGVDARLARVDIDFLSSGHSYFLNRDINADANGHVENVDAESRTEFAGILFPVTLTQTGGSAGNATTACTFTYTVKAIDATSLLTVATPVWNRPAKGKMVAGTSGTAYINGAGTVVFFQADEVPSVTVCT